MDVPRTGAVARRGLHGSVAAAIVVSVVALVVALFSDAGPTWSAENLATIFMPPVVFGGLLLLERRTSSEDAGRAWGWISLALVGLTWGLFALALLFVPVGLFGEWMDTAIG